MNQALSKLVRAAAKVPMTEGEREEQHIRFSYGSAKIENNDVTEEMVRRAASEMSVEVREPNG